MIIDISKVGLFLHQIGLPFSVSSYKLFYYYVNYEKRIKVNTFDNIITENGF